MSISVFSKLEILHLFIKPHFNSVRFCVLSSFRTSLQLCATLRGNRNMVLDVCKLGALQCMGQNFVLTSDSNCRWPEKRFTSCEDCQPGTICHGESPLEKLGVFFQNKSQKQKNICDCTGMLYITIVLFICRIREKMRVQERNRMPQRLCSTLRQLRWRQS